MPRRLARPGDSLEAGCLAFVQEVAVRCPVDDAGAQDGWLVSLGIGFLLISDLPSHQRLIRLAAPDPCPYRGAY